MEKQSRSIKSFTLEPTGADKFKIARNFVVFFFGITNSGEQIRSVNGEYSNGPQVWPAVTSVAIVSAISFLCFFTEKEFGDKRATRGPQ